MMEKVPYINYAELDEFYTIQQLAKLFGITKQDLKERCEQHGIEPRRNEVGEYGFVRFDVRKLHNILYHESRSNKKAVHQREEDPWA